MLDFFKRSLMRGTTVDPILAPRPRISPLERELGLASSRLVGYRLCPIIASESRVYLGQHILAVTLKLQLIITYLR